MSKKYELIGEGMLYKGHNLYRIRRLSDGVLGGWIQGEHNLCNDPNTTSWVGDEAKVWGMARVFEHSQVYEQATLWGWVEAYGSSMIYGCSELRDDCKVYGYAKVRGNARVTDFARAYGSIDMHGNAKMSGNSEAFGILTLDGNMSLSGLMVATRTPLSASLGRHDITVADKVASVGCIAHPFDTWREDIEKIGKTYNYSEEQIALYKKVLFSLMEEQERLSKILQEEQ